ncbi:hypothetical protein DUI87_13280 [Hirundo rustica rustica]|uniref:Reverse transcriptase domain-containing protein n=1 Tax=Hirundo rustica rustica TaxID=333673 RepID=A0A3M0KBL6_HIRRU|nr:hypothetical protein DUI87_13280 [Hirundo rustica rustica]
MTNLSKERRSDKKKLRKLGDFNLERKGEKKLQRDLVALYNSLKEKEGCSEVGIRLFSQITSGKTRGNALRLFQGSSYTTWTWLMSWHFPSGQERGLVAQVFHERWNVLNQEDMLGDEELADELAKLPSIIYQQCWLTGEIPDDWKLANVTPIHKKNGRKDPGNYRPVSLASVPGKIMEQFILSVMTQHLENGQGIRPSQHGFRRGSTCLTSLISFYDQVTLLVDAGRAVDVVYLDFSKTFDTVSHNTFLEKLAAHGLDRSTLCWVRNWLDGPVQSGGEQCCIQLGARHQWCSPGVCAGASSVQDLY